MHLLRLTLLIGLALMLVTALYLTLVGLELWGAAHETQVMGLESDEQELAWIEPATNSDEWGRVVSALKYLERDWPRVCPTGSVLQLDLERAFPRLTADVPEIALYFADAPERKLWLRWYKISGEIGAAAWVDKLRARWRPPLAVIGGGTSGRAQNLAAILEHARRHGWSAAAPLFLITTATAEDVKEGDEGQRLMNVYPGRTFRFSFTNRHMVEAVFMFLKENPRVWIHKGSEMNVRAGAVAVGNPWGTLGFMHASGELLACRLYTVSWADDRYSLDLADLFWELFKEHHPYGHAFGVGRLPYSVGDYYHPNAKEHASVGTFLSEPELSPIPPHSLLVLPTGAQRMRRYLGNLCRRAPLDARNLVVVNGDAITFHNIYRDRDYAWNIQDLPVSLVFFSHRNPIDAASGFGWERDERRGLSTTGTQDLLMNRDIVEAMLYAAFENGKLLADADRVLDRLRQTGWRQEDGPAGNRVCNTLVHAKASVKRPFFDAEGNRAANTGEHIVWLRPNYSGDHLDLSSTISIWEARTSANGPEWHAIATHQASYNQPHFGGE